MKIKSFGSLAIWATAVCIFLNSCYSASNTVTKTSAFPKVLERAKKDKRYFILYSGIDTFAVTSLRVENRREFTIHLDKMDSLHKVTLNNPITIPEKRAYLFMHDSTSYTLDEPHTLPFNKLARIELAD